MCECDQIVLSSVTCDFAKFSSAGENLYTLSKQTDKNKYFAV